MNKALVVSFIVIGGVVLIALIFGVGMMAGRIGLGTSGILPSNMMSRFFSGNYPGYGMMGTGYNMMGGILSSPSTATGSIGNTNTQPLTIDQVKQAVGNYLDGLNNPDLELKEIMIFNNNAYARIIEKSTGIGAMELLVDPATEAVFPEYGPNMMWNSKYGMMNGYGLTGGYSGMMRGFRNPPANVSSSMTVIPDQAVKIAQQYIDQNFPGSQADPNPDPFYGYYTIDILKDGKPTGMLSVNGFSQQAFMHTWHGTFITSSES